MTTKTFVVCCAICFSLVTSLPAQAQTATPNIPLPIARPDRPKPTPTPQRANSVTYQAACPVVMDGRAIGKISPPLQDNSCGTQSPYVITGVKSLGRTITLSSPVIFNCSMATAFVEWVGELDKQVEIKTNSTLAKINVGTSYACRRRNNEKTGKISEHGFANALDLTGFELENGEQIELPTAWTDPETAQTLIKTAHKLACQNFTTVLGPDANPLHFDHLHLDMGCHGKTCTYLICE